MDTKVSMKAQMWMLVVALACAFGFAGVQSAEAVQAQMQAQGMPEARQDLTADAAFDLQPAAEKTVVVEKYVTAAGAEFTQAKGISWVYDIGSLATSYYATDDRIRITATSGSGAVDFKPLKGQEGRFTITAKRPGLVKVTCTESWKETDESWDEEAQDWVETTQKKTATTSFKIKVVGLKNLSGAQEKTRPASVNWANFTFKLKGLPKDASVEYVSDSNKNGWSRIAQTGTGKVTFYVMGAGTHRIKVKVLGKTITCKATLRQLSLKRTAETRMTGSIVSCAGHKSQLGVALTGVKAPKAQWSSSNAAVARVNKKGLVVGRAPGRCYIKAKCGGATVRMLVEVTSPAAFQAVRNGFADMNTAIVYSQPNRMAAGYRDCSAFVSRCYWDSSQGRHIFAIGGDVAKYWAYTAAGQAQWLEGQGKRVAYGACSPVKLRPGDTIYYETDYAGKDASQWRYIDHAALYVGNGYALNTGGYGGKGSVGLRYYRAGDPSVKFIGRPCP